MDCKCVDRNIESVLPGWFWLVARDPAIRNLWHLPSHFPFSSSSSEILNTGDSHIWGKSDIRDVGGMIVLLAWDQRSSFPSFMTPFLSLHLILLFCNINPKEEIPWECLKTSDLQMGDQKSPLWWWYESQPAEILKFLSVYCSLFPLPYLRECFTLWFNGAELARNQEGGGDVLWSIPEI